MNERLKLKKIKPFVARSIPKSDNSPVPGYITESYLLGEGPLASSPEMAELLDRKARINSDPNGSDVVRDQCEVEPETLIRRNCRSLKNGYCEIGEVIREGRVYCPKRPERTVDLRSPVYKAD